jgi:hypothetical protein
MLGTGSQPDRFPEGVIVDTVVVNYFTAAGRFLLLSEILGGSVCVPTVVYDPMDDEILEDAGPISELEQGKRLHRRRSTDMAVSYRARERSKAALPHFEALSDHVAQGKLVPLELTDGELQIYSQLREKNYVKRYDRVVGLGRGEAAALAIAETRSMRLSTDDADGIHVAQRRNPRLEPLRIRRLLLIGVEHNIVGLSEARSIHLSMVGAGFWDTGRL